MEINVLALHAFAMLFISLQDLDTGEAPRNGLHDKLVQLHLYLKNIYEQDESIKVR